MKHLGDITKINGAEIEPVDCITFGSPCQGLSITGRREGLEDKRSGLFMEAVRVIKEMRTATNGLHPTFAIWENVPGAFSSNGGEDFRTVLEELARVARPDVTIPRPDGRWSRAGHIRGCNWSIAWRLLDAQYWGVPQRRKRITLVVDFRGERAGEILFERESVRGNPSQSVPPWKGIARNPALSAGTDREGRCFDARGNGNGDIAPTETGDHNGHISDYTAVVCESSGFSYGQSAKARSVGYESEKSPTLRGGEGGNQKPRVIYGIGSYDSNAWKSDNPHTGIYEAKIARTLDALNCGAPTCNQGGIAICEEVARTLKAKGNVDNRADSESYILCRATAQTNAETLANQCPTLNCDHEQPIIFDAHGNGDGQPAPPRWIVRRPTPLECERLQGYPDGWTDIGEWTDSKGKKHKAADTPRYKALGNSIALPQWWWLTCKMAEHLPENATLGSLFDGIGGFPLVWETKHGKGTARWASEIEEFPIAVTKRRLEET